MKVQPNSECFSSIEFKDDSVDVVYVKSPDKTYTYTVPDDSLDQVISGIADIQAGKLSAGSTIHSWVKSGLIVSTKED